MSDNKSSKPTNRVSITGKLAELDVRKGSKTDPTAAQFSINGALILNGDPNFKIPFRTAFPIRKLKKDGTPRKDWEPMVHFIQQAKPMSDVGMEMASMVTLGGRIVNGDFVTKDGNVVEMPVIDIGSLTIAAPTAEQVDKTTFTSVIRTVRRETNADGEETGRLKVEAIGLDFFGTAVPLRFIVPEKYADPFEDSYTPKTTAKLYLGHELHMQEKQQSTGGIGEQWTTGKPRIEWVLCGASDPISPDDSRAIPADAIKEGLAKRNDDIERKKAWQEGRNNTSEGSAVLAKEDDDLPF